MVTLTLSNPGPAAVDVSVDIDVAVNSGVLFVLLEAVVLKVIAACASASSGTSHALESVAVPSPTGTAARMVVVDIA